MKTTRFEGRKVNEWRQTNRTAGSNNAGLAGFIIFADLKNRKKWQIRAT
jgi:hypothetical protein